MSDRARWGWLLLLLAAVIAVLDSFAPWGRALPWVLVLAAIGVWLLVTGARRTRP